MVASVGPVAFCLELLPAWTIHDVFHALKLRLAIEFDGSIFAH